MKRIEQFVERWGIHPFLFGIYAILGLLIPNFDQVEPQVVVRPIVITILMVAVLLGASVLIFRDWKKASVFTTVIVILFFSYGHIYSALKSVSLFGMELFRHRSLIPPWAIFALAALIWLIRKPVPPKLNYTLNLISAFLVLFMAGQLAILMMNSNAGPSTASSGVVQAKADSPDIYYIILDGYGRQDVLQDVMGYDNSSFIDQLEALGFHVSRCSQSNYAQTQLSLSSSLNFNYLDALSAEGQPGTTQKYSASDLIKHSALRSFLEEKGYITVAFATGFNFTQITDASLYLSPSYGRQLNEFEYLLLKTTLVRAALDYHLTDATTSTAKIFRDRTLFTIEKLPSLVEDPRPKFVFAHIVIPHPPFVFGPSGEPIDDVTTRDDRFSPQEYIKGYVNQVIFIDHQMIPALKSIIDGSSRPVIIIVQGDHGPGRFSPEARMRNLNAYYVPGGQDIFYDSITPVNTFRVILDSYFGQHLPLLPDVSRFSTYNRPYDYQIVNNTCR